MEFQPWRGWAGLLSCRLVSTHPQTQSARFPAPGREATRAQASRDTSPRWPGEAQGAHRLQPELGRGSGAWRARPEASERVW